MTENQQMVVYAAAYESENAALDDLAAIEELHNDKLIGPDRRGRDRSVERQAPRGQAAGPGAHPFHPGDVRRRDAAAQGAPSRRPSRSPPTRPGSSRSASRPSNKGVDEASRQVPPRS